MAKKASSPKDISVSTGDMSNASCAARQADASRARYTVVARRYRPKTFDELVGQQTVAAALKSAIESDRVGHAYLFTGARGVGKTSTARIFAKALNLSKIQSSDLGQDLSSAIDSGEDMDVIEIDGASNRGIEEIRTLRANATVRPSRAAYKIYIIDEVHMLTLQAFNALLKTLEEPPEHVKFIFCTTDPEKIPITVLSRCQRFDFPPIKTDEIKSRLAQICESEGVTIDDEALRLIARRANGSMRDSQSLLEQLLSFASDKITVDSVHAMLGTADDSRLLELVTTLIQRDAGQALQRLESASQSGVDPGQMGEQLLGYLRDLMACGIGASEELLKTANPADYQKLRDMANQWGTMTLLAAIQLLDETLVKMRHSVQSRILLEVCLVQICHLQDLQGIANLAQSIRENAPLPPVIPTRVAITNATTQVEPSNSAGQAAIVGEKKNDEALKIKSNDLNTELQSLTTTQSVAPTHSLELTSELDPSINPYQSIRNEGPSLESELASSDDQDTSTDLSTSVLDLSPIHVWKSATQSCEGMLADYAHMAVDIEVDTGTDSWNVLLPPGCEFAMQILMDPKNFEVIRNNIRQQFRIDRAIRFKMLTSHSGADTAMPVVPTKRNFSQGQLIRSVSDQPLIAEFVKALNAEITKVDVPPDYSIRE